MGTTMTMNRVIHAAVRRDLGRLESALGSLPEGERARAKGLARAYQNLRSELTRHHESEDQLIWPMLAKLGVDAGLLATMESEHHAMAEALAETATAMDALATTGSPAATTAARESVVRTRRVVDQHLDHEEADLEPVLISHFESAEWKAVEKKLSRQPPAVAGAFFAWLTDGMSEEDRAYLRSTVPPPVTLVLSRVFGRRYHREVAPVWRAGSV